MRVFQEKMRWERGRLPVQACNSVRCFRKQRVCISLLRPHDFILWAIAQFRKGVPQGNTLWSSLPIEAPLRVNWRELNGELDLVKEHVPQWYKAGHHWIRHCLTSLKLEQITTEILRQNSNRHKRIELCSKSSKLHFWEFRTPFPPRYVWKNPRTIYAPFSRLLFSFTTWGNFGAKTTK